MHKKGALENIQMLRGVAAFLVVMHHLFPHYQAMGGKSMLIETISSRGFFGVDIFFVISGFIMAYTTMNKPRGLQSAKTFIKHRFFRIYLGYWPFLIAMILGLYHFNPTRLDGYDIIGSIFLTNPDMFQLILSVSWSLTYELYFYLLFTFTFLFTLARLRFILPIFTLFVAIIVIVSFSFNLQSRYDFFISPFLLEFFGGVLLFLWREQLVKRWMLPIVLAIIVVSLYFGITYELENGLYRVLSFGMAALFILYGVLILEEYKIFIAQGIVVRLGDASYTTYLSHLIFFQIFYNLGMRDFFTAPNGVMPLLGWTFVVSVILIFSLIYYQKIERAIYQKAVRRL